ncbi:hypothetical protein [Nocardia sp. CNY236]|uniref:hypothetical protein n=1 Tax=Nocardia sp. CNY236 TaxID=1169152 RepID=UPI00048B5A29|nr:hypothetical protein [Nocardia sp. CNY236]
MTAPQRARRRVMTVAALAAGAAITLSGCGAGQISQTADQVAAVNGNRADVGRIALRNVHIVYPADGTDYTNSEGDKAIVALSMINTAEAVADELVSITSDLGTVEITPAEGADSVELAPQRTVVAASEPAEPESTTTTTTAEDQGAHGTGADTTDNPEANPIHIEITDLTADITPGLTYNLSFNFKNNGTVQVSVPVDAGLHTERHESDMSGPAEAGAGGGH